MFKPKLYLPSNIRRDKQNNTLITSSSQLNNAIDLLEWFGINLISGNSTKLLAENGTWQHVNSFAWSLGGNSGTNTTDNFLGTTDNVGLRIQSTSDINKINGVSVIGTSTDGGYGVYLQGNGVEGVEVRGVGETGVLLFGNGSTTDITITPTNGTLRITNLNEGDGKILTSDTSGYRDWETS